MKTYDSFAIHSSGLFEKFNNPGDPVFAFSDDENTLAICRAISRLFGKCGNASDDSVLSVSTAELTNGTVLDTLYIHEGTPAWVRSIIDDYLSALNAFCNERRLFIGAAEFPTWYGDKPTLGDFSDDIFFVIAKKSVFGNTLSTFENAKYGWKLPDAIPVFLFAQEVTADKMVLSPILRLRRILPFQFSHLKKELYEMCAGNEIIINAAPTSESARFVTNFNHIQ